METRKHICKSCNHEFKGKFCNQCGEKILEEADFTIGHVITQAIGAITNLDSKLFRSMFAFMLTPGELSKKFVEGERVKYMKPFQIFILANILFFIFLDDIDIFRTPSVWYFQEDFDGFRVLDKVREIMTEKELSQDQVAIMYDAKSSNFAKGFQILLIPFVAFVGFLLNIRKKKSFGKHIIFATHFLAFTLLFSVLWTGLMYLVPMKLNKWYFIIPISLAEIYYYTIGTRIFYEDRWGTAIAKGVLGLLLTNIFIQLYRMVINQISLNSI